MSKKNQETPKITKEELEGLRKIVNSNNEINSKRASICLQKEVAIRQLEKEFDETWEMLDLQSNKGQEEQKNYLADLDTKYGQGKSYDLSTGEIKDVEKNEQN